jgi:prepilin-type N-terminal cleavage/methylation domain-containing protein
MNADLRPTPSLERRSGARSVSTSNAGFTLIEMLMVIAIVGVLFAIAVPNMVSARQGFQMSAASSTMTSRLMEARMESLKRNRQVDVVLNGATRTLTTSVTVAGVTTVIAGPEYLPSGVVFNLGGAATYQISIDSLGRPVAPPRAFAITYPGSGLTRTLSVLSTGRITIQ